jgi:hypothetical protein
MCKILVGNFYDLIVRRQRVRQVDAQQVDDLSESWNCLALEVSSSMVRRAPVSPVAQFICGRERECVCVCVCGCMPIYIRMCVYACLLVVRAHLGVFSSACLLLLPLLVGTNRRHTLSDCDLFRRVDQRDPCLPAVQDLR